MLTSLTALKPATGRAGVNCAPSYKVFEHFGGLFDALKVTPLLTRGMRRDTFWQGRNSAGARYVTP